MEAWVDYYHVLNVHERADRDSIEAVYRSLCKKYHPDLNHTPEAENLMKEINIAWETLKDDQKRRIYDLEWQRRISRAQTAPVGRASSARSSAQGEAPRSRAGGWGAYAREEAPPDADTAARIAVAGYFDGIARGRFKAVYDLLCKEDRQSIPLESFIEWQTSVAGTYHIEHFNIATCKDYEKFPVNETHYKAKRFMLDITERNVRSGEWTRYRLTKFAVEQDGKWRVYLGYRNLDHVITQFTVLTGTAGEAIRRTIDLTTGLPNRRGFLEKCKAEAYRYERYRRDCAIAVAEVTPVRSVEDDVRQKILVQAACSLRAAVRLIDQVGALGQGRFAVLLAECDASQARSAARRISRRVEREALACFDSKVQIKWKLKQYTGGEMDDLLVKCEK